MGCGPGNLAARLLRQLANRCDVRYFGTDLSPLHIQKARHNYPHGQFVVASALELPFAAGDFQLLIACELLEHLTNPPLAMDELARVAKRSVIFSVLWESM